jgi:hypothetical protein
VLAVLIHLAPMGHAIDLSFSFLTILRISKISVMQNMVVFLGG